jgi:hypothetical protein
MRRDYRKRAKKTRRPNTGKRPVCPQFSKYRKTSRLSPIFPIFEAVRDLETAKKRVVELAENSPGEYLVFCEQTSKIVDCFVLA